MNTEAALFAVVVIIVVFKAWHGWRIGVVRQVAGLVALVAAVLAAVFAGPFVAPLLVNVPQIPEASRAQEENSQTDTGEPSRGRPISKACARTFWQ